MVVIRKKKATKKAFDMITVITLHLKSYVRLLEFMKTLIKHGEKHKELKNYRDL